MTKSHCLICNVSIEQKVDGSGGIEIGFCKWFTTIQPWEVMRILCNSCGEKVMKRAGVDEHGVEQLHKQVSVKK